MAGQQIHLKAIEMRATENKWCGVQMCTGLSVVYLTSISVWSVCIVSHFAACVFFWPKFRAALSVKRCCQLFLNILARRSAIASLSVGAVANCNVAWLVGHAFSPHASFLFPSLLFSCARVQHTPSHQFLRAVCWWRAIAPHSQWSEAVSEKDAILFNLAVGFLVGVCSCVTIGWAQRGSSRENVVSSEQFRSLPTAVESLSMGSKGQGVPEPRPLPPCRDALDLETTVLNTEVQEILGEGEGNGDELAGWSAASMGSSSRVPKCRETIRARLLGNSACGG